MALVIDSREMEWKGLKDGIQVRTVMGEFLTAQIVKIDKGTKTPVHRHDSEQIGYVLEGRAQFVYGENCEILTVEAGVFFYFASNEPHGLQDVPQDTVLVDIFGPPREDYAVLAVRLKR